MKLTEEERVSLIALRGKIDRAGFKGPFRVFRSNGKVIHSVRAGEKLEQILFSLDVLPDDPERTKICAALILAAECLTVIDSLSLRESQTVSLWEKVKGWFKNWLSLRRN